MGVVLPAIAHILKKRASPRAPERPALPVAYHSLVRKALPRPPAAVLLDIYGTLFISSSGDVGAAMENSEVAAFQAAYADATGALISSSAAQKLKTAYFSTLQSVRKTMQDEHRHVPHYVPEIDIREIWSNTLRTVGSVLERPADPVTLAACYEANANPVWPMPGSRALFAALTRSTVRLGLVSNAQFYTDELARSFWGLSWRELGCEPQLSAFSYRVRRAKPDPELFSAPLASLRAQGIDSHRVVYVGNDMRNDVQTASACGCMTVLFAGDRTSLRLRAGLGIPVDILDSIVVSLDELPMICRPWGTNS